MSDDKITLRIIDDPKPIKIALSDAEHAFLVQYLTEQIKLVNKIKYMTESDERFLNDLIALYNNFDVSKKIAFEDYMGK